jgi:AcrR family transcriptional regulator
MTAAAEHAGLDSKERILRAALDAFSENGFDGATTRDIASRAGVNLGLIKYYFDGKLKLWQAAVDRAFADLREALGDDATKDARLASDAHTRSMVRRYVHFVAQRPELVRLMHDEGKRRGPRMRWLVDRHTRPLYEGVRGLLANAQKRGLLPAHIDPLHFHYVLVGAVGIIFHQAEECRRLTGVDPMAPESIEAHADAVIHLLLGPEENA